MTSFEIYLLLLASPIKNGLVALFFGGVIAVILYNGVRRDHYTSEDEKKEITALTKRWAIILTVIGLTALIFPSTKTLITMQIVPHIINNETAQDLPEKLLEYLDKKLDNEIDNLKSGS